MEINIAPEVNLTAQDVMTGRGCVIGQSGSGKSYLVGVIVEELCRNGLPFLVVDTEGEYKSLKSAFNAIWVGEDSKADVGLDVDYAQLFSESIESGVPIVFDVSDVMNKAAVVYKALEALYGIEEEKRAPYLVIMEEADKFSPQIVRPKANPVEEISVRGRKRGIGLLVATQRPANISKNVLAQCSYGFVGKLSIDNDLQAVSVLFEGRKTLDQIPMLSTGTFMPFGLPEREPIKVKRRSVLHVGSTPVIGAGTYQKKDIRMGSILKDLKSKPVPSSRQIPRAKGAQAQINGETVPVTFDRESAEEYASRLAKRQYLLFGRQESVESVELKYFQAVLCKLRVPTYRKNEYVEGYAMMKGDSFVTVRDGRDIHFEKPKGKAAVRLDETDKQIFSVVARRKRSDREALMSAAEVSRQKAVSSIRKLERAGLIEARKGSYHAVDMVRHLQSNAAGSEKSKIDAESVVNYDRDMARETQKALGMIYPGSEALSSTDVYVPIYEITLRRGNRVRIFRIDGLSGGRLEGI